MCSFALNLLATRMPWFGLLYHTGRQGMVQARFYNLSPDPVWWIRADVNKVQCKALNTLRPRQNGRHFPDDIFKCIFLNENAWIFIKISLKFVPKGPINNISALVLIMAWRRSGDKPLSEPMMDSLLTHICVTRPQWVIPRSIFSQNFRIHTPCSYVLASCGVFLWDLALI